MSMLYGPRNMVVLQDFPANATFEQNLQYLLCESMEEQRALSLLSESDKAFSARTVVKKISKYIKDKCDSIDFRDVDKSRGDITTCSIYKQQKAAMTELLRDFPEFAKTPAYNTLSTLEKNIIKNVKSWKTAYSLKQTTNILLYRTLCHLYFHCVSVIVGKCVHIEWTKDKFGTKRPTLKYSTPSGLEKASFLQTAAKFNTYYNNGYIAEYLRTSKDQEEQALQESIFVTATIALVAFLAILTTIRELILKFFTWRRAISKEFKVGAEYLEFKAALNDNNPEKQRELAEKFTSIADFIGFTNDTVDNVAAKDTLRNEEAELARQGLLPEGSRTSPSGSLLL